MFRVRLVGTGVIAGDRGLESQAGLVVVTLTDWPSSGASGGSRRETGVPWVLRLAGRFPLGVSLETRRVPNFAFAEDSLLYEDEPTPLRVPP